MTAATQTGVAPASSLQPPACLDADGQRVWTWLARARGHEQGVTAGRLGEILGWSEVAVRECITANLDSFPELVVASPSCGYYVAVTPEEVEAYDADLHSRGVKILIRRRRIRQQAAKCGFARMGRHYFKAAPAAGAGKLF